MDRHFNSSAHVLEQLWLRRIAQPDGLAIFESLAWVDVRLVLAYPRDCYVVARTEEGGERYMRPTSFQTLTRLYATEGFLRTAYELAELERQHFAVEDDDTADVRARLEAVGAETALR